MKIQRYNPEIDDDELPCMEKDLKGEWVKWEDIEHLVPDRIEEIQKHHCEGCGILISYSFLTYHNGLKWHSECLKKMLGKTKRCLTP